MLDKRMSSFRCVWLTVLVLVATLAPKQARACKKRHQTPFELFETALAVAHVTVTAVPAPTQIVNHPGPGEVALSAHTMLKGAASAAGTLTSRLGGTSCDVPFAVGQEAVIFLSAQGYPEGAHEGYLREVTTWLPVLTAWRDATTVAARVEVLSAAATNAAPAVRAEAAKYLLEAPALLEALDAGQRARLVAQLTAERHNQDLALVLVRLREPVALRSLPRWQALARSLVKVRTFEGERDPARLAEAITRARRKAERWAAFERCERARGQSLGRFVRYIEDLDRTKAAELAEACRTGKPLE